MFCLLLIMYLYPFWTLFSLLILTFQINFKPKVSFFFRTERCLGYFISISEYLTFKTSPSLLDYKSRLRLRGIEKLKRVLKI